MLNLKGEIQAFNSALEEKADLAYRAGNQAVVHGDLRMVGVRMPHIRQIAKDWKRAHRAVSYDELIPLVETLWDGDLQEERILAMELLQSDRRLIPKLDWDHFDRWRRRSKNWALNDMLGTRVLAPWMLAEPESRLDHLQGLIEDTDLWSRRLALVATCPINRGHTGLTIPELTLALVGRVKAERDPMITKAVSWALRELSKTHPGSVAEYLDREREALAAHVVREVQNKLRTGLKSGKPRK